MKYLYKEVIWLSDDEKRGTYIVTEDGKTVYIQSSSNERLLAMLIYLTNFITSLIVPIIPFIIWLLKRDESEYIDYHGKEFLNFYLSYLIGGLALLVLTAISFVFSIIPVIGWIPILFIGLAWSVLGVVFIVLSIIAAIKSFNGELYKIPFIFRFIK